MIAEPEFPLAAAAEDAPDLFDDAAEEVLRKIHRTIADVSADFDAFRFNRAVARIRELTNALANLDGDSADRAWTRRLGFETTVQLIAPVMPHLAEELWSILGHKVLLSDTDWPRADEAYLSKETVTIAVQVNGKLRGTIDLPFDVEKQIAEDRALALENVARVTGGVAPRKVIVVPNKVINVVL